MGSRQKGYIRIYNDNKELIGYLSPNGKISKNKTSFSGNVYCFLENEKGEIWIGTKRTGLFLLRKKDENSYIIQQYSHHPEK